MPNSLIASSGQEDFEDFEELSLEDLLEIEVVTAAKKAQKISQAPAAMYVITDEEIRQSGATSIPDVLRMVPGIDVMEITATDFVINARGFNKEMSNKMLVLIDGRSVYWDFYGLVIWDSFPIGLEEIKRIEIVKGPGSALYGANAFSGVINILTKSPEELRQGTSVSTNYGSPNTTLTSLIHVGGRKNLDYKVSLGWNMTHQWNDPEKKEGEVKKLDAILRYRVNETSGIAFSGGHNEGEGMTMTGIGKMDRQQEWNHLMLDYNHSNFGIRLFWNRVHADVLQQATSDRNFFEIDTYDTESQYIFSLGSLNSVILGGSYRLNVGQSDMILKKFDQSLYAIYAQDEFRPIRNLAITLGIRYDGHSLFKDRITPRGNILLSPIKNHFLRFSYGTAFRNPSFIESYLSKDSDISDQISLALPSNSVVVEARGNPQLSPEKITSFEAGYEALLNRRIKCKLDLFYYRLKDFVFFQTVGYQDISYLLGFPTGSVIVPAEQSYVNEGKASAKGSEFSLDVLVNNWLSGLVNYSYQDLAYDADNPATPENEKGQTIKTAPRHKVNAGLRFEHKSRFSANLMMHHVSQTEWKEDWAYGKVDPYTLFNLGLGYKVLQGRFETNLSVFNLFDNKHFEYPECDKDGNPGVGHRIGRQITFGISVDF
jgi:iron complex outermembrane receptor protein